MDVGANYMREHMEDSDPFTMQLLILEESLRM